MFIPYVTPSEYSEPLKKHSRRSDACINFLYNSRTLIANWFQRPINLSKGVTKCHNNKEKNYELFELFKNNYPES
jgi:hypothetical protein